MSKIKEMPTMSPEDIARYWKFVEKIDDVSVCWPWKGHPTTTGYGAFRVGRKMYGAHRIAYMLCYPEGSVGLMADFMVLHRCDNRPCCNPNHLFLGDHTDNMRDAFAKKRIPRIGKRGESSPVAKLTQKEAQEIYNLCGKISHEEIGAAFGVSIAMVSLIRNGHRWPDLVRR